MNVSRNRSGGNALMVLTLDTSPDAELLRALEGTEGVRERPKFIELPG